MVDTLSPYFDVLNGLKTDIPIYLQKVLKDRQDEVIAILRDEQLAEGIGPEGEELGVYAEETQRIAKDTREYTGGRLPKKDKIAGEPYNFEWSGGLFSDMTLFFDDVKSFSIFSKDEKANTLKEKYGDIFTLTDAHNERVNTEILLPALNEYIERRLTSI